MFRAGLKAGIIMGIVAMVVGVIPLSALEMRPEALGGATLVAEVLFMLLMTLVPWFASGILAARFGAAAALTTGGAAGAGALAGAIAQIISQIAGMVMNFIFFGEYLTAPPGAPTAPPVSAIFIVIACAGVSIAIAAGLGALGGIVGRAISVRRGS